MGRQSCPLIHSNTKALEWGDITVRDEYFHVEDGYDLQLILFERIMTERERFVMGIMDVLDAFNAKLVTKISLKSKSARSRFKIVGKGQSIGIGNKGKKRTWIVKREHWLKMRNGRKKYESRKAKKGRLDLNNDKPGMILHLLEGMPSKKTPKIYEGKKLSKKIEAIYLETDTTKINDWPFQDWEGFAVIWSWS